MTMTAHYPRLGAVIVLFLAVTAQVPWRTGAVYSGGADPVVLAKAVMTVVALAIAVLLIRRHGDPRRIPAAPLLWLLAYLACTLIGGSAAGATSTSVVLIVRMILLMLVLTALVAVYTPVELMHALIVCFGIMVFAGAVTDRVLGTSPGRLRGGLPPLHANELAALTVICILWLVATVCCGEERLSTLILLPAAVVVLILTESRTSLIAAALGILVLGITAARMRRTTVALVALVPFALYALLSMTSAVQSQLSRGGKEQLGTFANREIAWQAALAPGQGFWQTWFGRGLGQKHVEVIGQWWTSQVIDSSWVSALVQGGWVGLAIVACWMISVILRADRAPKPYRGLWWAIAIFLAVRGFFESGLFDSSTMFITFAITSFGVLMPHATSKRRSQVPSVDQRGAGRGIAHRSHDATQDERVTAPVSSSASLAR